MSSFAEAFVDTPRGRLRVWTMDGATIEAHTMGHEEKVGPHYRDIPAAQDCAEHLSINRIPYALGLYLLPDDHPSLRRSGVLANHQGWALRAGGLVLRRPDAPWLAPTQGAYNIVRRQVFPALAEWANTSPGIALRTLGELRVLTAQLRHIPAFTSKQQQERERLAQRHRELTALVRELTAGPQGGVGA